MTEHKNIVDDNATQRAHSKPTVPAVAGDPGYGLGIAGFIVSFFVGVAGLIMSAIALNQSKRVGKKNSFAFAGLIIGIVKTALDVLGIVAATVAIIFAIHYCTNNADQCRDTSGSDQIAYPQQTDPNTDQTY